MNQEEEAGQTARRVLTATGGTRATATRAARWAAATYRRRCPRRRPRRRQATALETATAEISISPPPTTVVATASQPTTVTAGQSARGRRWTIPAGVTTSTAGEAMTTDGEREEEQ